MEEALAREGVTSATTLAGSIDADVAIVGGGYAGLWTALELAQRDRNLRIVLLEADLCGSGASGKNGGFSHGYWVGIGGLRKLFGDPGALAVARAASEAQRGIASFIERSGEDVWWRSDGMLKVSASAAQDAKIDMQLQNIRELGVPEQAVQLTQEEMRARCNSPVYRKAIYFPEGATVHPARLARALRRAIIDLGVRVYERTQVDDVQPGRPNIVMTDGGSVRADEVVLTTNAALTGFHATKRFLTNFSSYVVMTEPAPEILDRYNWRSGEGISDGRMFIHYFRNTPDGRIAMGTPGPIGFGGQIRSRKVLADRDTVKRAHEAIVRFFPEFAEVGIARAWGGPVDVASDNYPFFGTVSGSRIHYSAGYSGHGVNATYLGGKCLASMVLRQDDEWTRLPLFKRSMPMFPPEPFRFVGGTAIRDAIVACEDAEEEGRKPRPVSEFVASLPAKLNLRVGTR